MCGRYAFAPDKDFYNRFRIKNILPELKAHYNVAPGFQMPVIIKENANQAVLMKWGLVPSWSSDLSIGFKLINARCETLSEKASFRKPLETQRCLVPVSGFYEWKKTPEGKIPYYIFLRETCVFSFAGLYDIWRDIEGRETKSYTIITTTPNDLIKDIHDRMPVILDKRYEDMWIDEGEKDIMKLTDLLKPYEGDDMEIYLVSREVNKVGSDGPSLIKPYKENSPQTKLF
jgi:putative SOS response-associated peptidase YedK